MSRKFILLCGAVVLMLSGLRANVKSLTEALSCVMRKSGSPAMMPRISIRIRYVGLLCMLILKILQMRSTFGWSLSKLAGMLRYNLLTYRDLWVWLNKPHQTPAIGPPDGQLLLFE